MPKTKIIRIDPDNPDQKSIQEAALLIAKGKLVIIPTETVYGVAVSMQNKAAVKKIYKIKNRPQDKRLSLLIGQKEEANKFASHITPAAYRLMDTFWPGPLTVVLNSQEHNTIALRMPDHKVALAIVRQAGVPVLCPSANLSGKAAPKNFEEAIKDLNGLVDAAIDSGPAQVGLESSVVDLTDIELKILREGAVNKNQIEEVVKNKKVLFICTGNSCRSVMAEGLLKKKLKEKGRLNINVTSAGIMPVEGMSATQNTKIVLAKENIDVSSHRSRQVNRELIDESDIILVMEKIHELKVLDIAPEAKNRVFLLKEFAKIGGNDLDIRDPIGSSEEFYQDTLRVIQAAVDRVAEII